MGQVKSKSNGKNRVKNGGRGHPLHTRIGGFANAIKKFLGFFSTLVLAVLRRGFGCRGFSDCH